MNRPLHLEMTEGAPPGISPILTWAFTEHCGALRVIAEQCDVPIVCHGGAP